MKNEFGILDLLLVALLIAVALVRSCGVLPTGSPDIGPTPVPPSPSAVPAEVERARDAALAYIRAHYADQSAPAGLSWTGAETTPPQLLGANQYRLTSGDWVIEVVVPVVGPDSTVYDVAVSNGRTGFAWEGQVDGAGRVTEHAAGGVDAARQALNTFFALLNAGRYGEAVAYYGGPYDMLQVWNPDIARDDYAALFQAGCTANGLRCLPVRNVVREQQTAAGEYQFVVEFAYGGSLFVRGPCCGATETEMPSQSQFTYTVKVADGRCLVQELPVYVP